MIYSFATLPLQSIIVFSVETKEGMGKKKKGDKKGESLPEAPPPPQGVSEIAEAVLNFKYVSYKKHPFTDFDKHCLVWHRYICICCNWCGPSTIYYDGTVYKYEIQFFL